MKKLVVLVTCLCCLMIVQFPLGLAKPFLSGRFVLTDSFGFVWTLNRKNMLLYGSVDFGYAFLDARPAYGFLIGSQMVLWCDNTGGEGFTDSFAYVGYWDVVDLLYYGTWVSYAYPDYYEVGLLSMKLGVTAEITVEEGSPAIVQSGTHGSGFSPRSERLSETLADRGVICYIDSYGFIWDLDLYNSHILYGTVNLYGNMFPAYGWIFGNEMMLWSDSGGGVPDFVYTGCWCECIFNGAWVCYPPKGHGWVELWPC